MITRRRNHAPDLMVFTLGNTHLQQRWRNETTGFGSEGFVLVFEQDARQQSVAQGLISRLGKRRPINLGNRVTG